uniref:Uncharacterized protein n=1 Tax=Cacopsylla melanoneura TaxID=428564 RepID=A0A8D8QLH9_9HEMI
MIPFKHLLIFRLINTDHIRPMGILLVVFKQIFGQIDSLLAPIEEERFVQSKIIHETLRIIINIEWGTRVIVLDRAELERVYQDSERGDPQCDPKVHENLVPHDVHYFDGKLEM